MISVRQKYWLQVAGWIFCIYSTLYIVRPICEFLRKKTPFVFIVNFTIVATAAMLLIHLLKKIKITKVTAALLGIIVMIYVYALTCIPIAEEKIHFLEYGFLAFLIHRAIRLDVRGIKSYVWGLLLTAIFGWIDEVIQYYLPNRYFDWRDVAFNTAGGILGLLVTYLILQKSTEGRIEKGEITSL